MASSSEVTLITPTPQIRLEFESNSMLDTIVLRHSDPLYTVSTNKHRSTTEMRVAMTHELVAHIERKELLPDTVAFACDNGGKAMRVSKWLKHMKLADGLYVLLCTNWDH